MDKPIRIDDYLTLNHVALDKLSDVDRVHVLGDLAQRAGKWLAHARADEIDNLRIAYGGDKAVADALGVDRKAIADIGDGPVIAHAGQSIRPALLRRGLELLIEYAPAGTNARDLMQALEILKKPGRPSGNLLLAAARRIVRGAPRDLGRMRHEMPHEEYRTYARAIAHASDLTTGSDPTKGYTRDWDVASGND